MMEQRIIVFNYNGKLAYATEQEYIDKIDYMYMLLPHCRDFDEAKDYLQTVCNYDNMIIDMTEEFEDDFDGEN